MNNLLLLTSTIACLATTSNAFTSSHLLPACDRSHNVPRFASSNDNIPFFATSATTDDDTIDIDCGPGFQKIDGADGPCCAFDFDAVSSKLPPSIFDNNPTLQTKYEEKNLARRKFNLKPLSPEEFVVLQAQIHAMEREESLKQDVARQAAVIERKDARKQQQLKLDRQEKEQEAGIFQNFMGSIFQDTCQSNYDCDRPEVCCDFGFKKTCCSSGNTNRDIENELALIPVPQRG